MAPHIPLLSPADQASAMLRLRQRLAQAEHNAETFQAFMTAVTAWDGRRPTVRLVKALKAALPGYDVTHRQPSEDTFGRFRVTMWTSDAGPLPWSQRREVVLAIQQNGGLHHTDGLVSVQRVQDDFALAWSLEGKRAEALRQALEIMPKRLEAYAIAAEAAAKALEGLDPFQYLIWP